MSGQAPYLIYGVVQRREGGGALTSLALVALARNGALLFEPGPDVSESLAASGGPKQGLVEGLTRLVFERQSFVTPGVGDDEASGEPLTDREVRRIFDDYASALSGHGLELLGPMRYASPEGETEEDAVGYLWAMLVATPTRAALL